jgi:hypothetical protein
LTNSRCKFVTESGFKIGNACESFTALTVQGDEYECVWVQPLNIIKEDSGFAAIPGRDMGGTIEVQYMGVEEFSLPHSAAASLMHKHQLCLVLGAVMSMVLALMMF